MQTGTVIARPSRRLLGLALAAFALTGCGKKRAPEQHAPSVAMPQTLPETLFLTDAPEGVRAIPQLKETVKPGDKVVLRGVVGGRAKPFVDDRAVFTVVDSAVANHCTQQDEGCKTPWDYCCVPPEDLRRNTVTVQVVDAQGRPLQVDLGSSGRISPLATLVIRGTVSARPNAEILIVNATGVFLEASR